MPFVAHRVEQQVGTNTAFYSRILNSAGRFVTYYSYLLLRFNFPTLTETQTTQCQILESYELVL
jgi:hypothetical protein